jgi:hypothetical protein
MGDRVIGGSGIGRSEKQFPAEYAEIAEKLEMWFSLLRALKVSIEPQRTRRSQRKNLHHRVPQRNVTEDRNLVSGSGKH